MDFSGNWSTSSPVGLKQFRAEGCLSYLICDISSHQAVLIDPSLDLMDDYHGYLADHELALTAVLDTHTHADHFSASHLLRLAPEVVIGMSHQTQSERPTRKLKSGDEIKIGNFALRTLETPGHTPDSLSFYLPPQAQNRAGLVFTGDTLFIGSSGRTDFQGANPADQWESINRVLGSLPDDTIVLPGHDYNGLIFSTIGTEKKLNPHWKLSDKSAFIEMKNAEIFQQDLGLKQEIIKRIEFNSTSAPKTAPPCDFGSGAATSCAAPLPDRNPMGRITALQVDKYANKLRERGADTAFIDVREEFEYQAGHIPGTMNIPLSELVFHYHELKQAKRIYFSCQSGRRSMVAAINLSYLGLPDLVNVDGGFKAWALAGHTIEK